MKIPTNLTSSSTGIRSATATTASASASAAIASLALNSTGRPSAADTSQNLYSGWGRLRQPALPNFAIAIIVIFSLIFAGIIAASIYRCYRTNSGGFNPPPYPAGGAGRFPTGAQMAASTPPGGYGQPPPYNPVQHGGMGHHHQHHHAHDHGHHHSHDHGHHQTHHDAGHSFTHTSHA